MGTSKEDRKYSPVDITTLEAGMLVERPLYAYFSSNQKYIRLIEALHPLEVRTLEKFKKIGAVFSTEPSIDDRYASLSATARAVRLLCNDRDAASFEKNRSIRDTTRWLAPHVLKRGGDLYVPVFFFHRAFGVPNAETLQFMSDLSVVMCERSLKVATIAGVLALWLGYSDTAFLTQFAATVFCEEVGRYNNAAVVSDFGKITDEHRVASAQMIVDGHVPGVAFVDERFTLVMSHKHSVAAAGDELRSLIEYARWVCGADDKETQGIAHWRVTRKLKKFLGGFSTNEEKAVAA